MNPSIRNSTRRLLINGTLMAALWLASSSVQGQQLTQSITLQPGWNAVWLEVDPTNRSPAAVFGGLPLASVWTWSERVTATEFIQNPATAGWNKNQWLAWFPTNSPEAPLANLFAIIPARAYIIKLNGTDPVTFQVSGKVVPQPTAWSPNLYNLRGFPVHPTTPPTFRAFFRYSTAFWNSSEDTPHGIYRLDPTGTWSAVSANDTMKRGEAYWVYVNGASDYPAPESWSASTGDSVYFSPLTYRTTLTLANRTSEPRTIIFSTGASLNKAYQVEDPLNFNPFLTRPFLQGYTVQMQPNSSVELFLYLDRTRRQPGASGVIFSFNDQMGTLQYIGVSSDGSGALQPGQTDDVGVGGGTNVDESYPLQAFAVTALVDNHCHGRVPFGVMPQEQRSGGAGVPVPILRPARFPPGSSAPRGTGQRRPYGRRTPAARPGMRVLTACSPGAPCRAPGRRSPSCCSCPVPPRGC